MLYLWARATVQGSVPAGVRLSGHNVRPPMYYRSWVDQSRQPNAQSKYLLNITRDNGSVIIARFFL